jgi:hypothetical protein
MPINFFALNKSKLTAIIGMAICIIIVLTAIPRLMAAFYMLYPAQVNQQFKEDYQSVSIEHLLKSEEYIKQSLSWFSHGAAWQSLTINTARQLNFVTSDLRPKKIQAIYQANTQGLALSPIDPYGWYRLAIIEKNRQDLPLKVLNSLRLSCYSGRVEPALLIKRVSLFHHYLTSLDTEMLSILYDQIQLSSIFRLKDLVKLAQKEPVLIISIQKALQYAPENWNNFIQQFKKAVRKK